MYVLRAHLKHFSAITRYSAAVFMETRVVIFCKRLRRHNKEGPDAFTSGPSRAPVQLIEKGRRQERASSVSQRIDVISLRGPECDALRGCPRFALFYMAVL